MLILGCFAVLVSIGGAGHHVEAVVMTNPDTLSTRGKLIYALSWFSAVSNMLSRASIVALYLRIFPKGITRFFSWAILFYLIGFLISQIIVGVVECRPIQYLWNTGISEAKCINLFLYYRLSTVMNIIGDIIIIIIPIYRIWTLQASTARKAGIVLAFLSGGLSVNVSDCCSTFAHSSRGLVASCIRAHAFFGDERSSTMDPACK